MDTYRVKVFPKALHDVVLDDLFFTGNFRPFQNIEVRDEHLVCLLSLPFKDALERAFHYADIWSDSFPVFSVERLCKSGEWQLVFWKFSKHFMPGKLSSGMNVLVFPSWFVLHSDKCWIQRCNHGR